MADEKCPTCGAHFDAHHLLDALMMGEPIGDPEMAETARAIRARVASELSDVEAYKPRGFPVSASIDHVNGWLGGSLLNEQTCTVHFPVECFARDIVIEPSKIFLLTRVIVDNRNYISGPLHATIFGSGSRVRYMIDLPALGPQSSLEISVRNLSQAPHSFHVTIFCDRPMPESPAPKDASKA